MVIAIHTAPFLDFGATPENLLTRTLCRVAVPFFLMTTGFFLFDGGFADWRRTGRAVLHTVWMYAAGIVLCLPLHLYRGDPQRWIADPAVFLQELLVDGTMYHLWYFPALMLGLLLACLLLRRLALRGALAVSGVLYLLGLLGDSYFMLVTARIPSLARCYERMFTLFTHTRNGLFYVPIFLVLGAALSARYKAREAQGGVHRVRLGTVAGLLLSTLLLLLEGYLLHLREMRFDSMYLMLIPCMIFLFDLLSVRRGGRSVMARDVSMTSYLLHPLVIAALHAVSVYAPILYESGLLQFFTVTVLTLVGSVVLWLIWRWLVPGRKSGGRPTRIEIDLSALAHNARVLMEELPQGCCLMAVVKADAYGVGAVPVSQTLWSAGVRHFAVATLEEAVALRRAGIGGQILILGYTDPARAGSLWRYRLTQTLVDEHYAAALDGRGYPIRVHLKIDTGMHRIGVDARDSDAIARVFRCRQLKIEGVFTHLCVADENTVSAMAFTETQLELFRDVSRQLEKSGQFPTLHAKNSAGILNYPDPMPEQLARAGIALYGAYDAAGSLRHPDLCPVIAFRSAVVLLRRVGAGESVGYGRAWIAPRDSAVAVVPMGYADGIPRDYGERGGEVLIRGKRCPVIGRVCMDQLMVDVSALPQVMVGDTVTWIGADGGERIAVEEVARICKTVSNEVLCRLTKRPERIYFDRKE